MWMNAKQKDSAHKKFTLAASRWLLGFDVDNLNIRSRDAEARYRAMMVANPDRDPTDLQLAAENLCQFYRQYPRYDRMEIADLTTVSMDVRRLLYFTCMIAISATTQRKAPDSDDQIDMEVDVTTEDAYWGRSIVLEEGLEFDASRACQSVAEVPLSRILIFTRCPGGECGGSRLISTRRRNARSRRATCTAIWT